MKFCNMVIAYLIIWWLRCSISSSLLGLKLISILIVSIHLSFIYLCLFGCVIAERYRRAYHIFINLILEFLQKFLILPEDI